MKVISLLATGVGLVLFGVDALRFEKRDSPAILKIPLQKKTPEVLARSLIERRAGTVETPEVNYQRSLLYIVELLIGTPPQSTFVQLDTGSSDLVVETSSSDICSAAPPNPCINFGAYDANSSSTYEYIDSNFQVAYGGGDGATGDWCQDNLSIGGATLQNVEFGIQYRSTIQEGILGVSYPIIEGRNTFSGEPIYDNLPVLLVKQGYIASRSFSLWANDDRSASGTLLFGGIDTSKFSGELVTIDLVASGFDGFPGVVDFTLVLNSVTGTDGSGNPVSFVGGSAPMTVLMDSGTTITLLSAALVTSIWGFVGATPYNTDPSSASILCSAGATTETINFSFNGITIHVPLSQLVIYPDSNNELCLFGIAIGNGFSIIGDTVLAAMYLVYDLDNNQISMASTVFNPTAPENILQIMAGPGGVPHPAVASSSIASSTVVAGSPTYASCLPYALTYYDAMDLASQTSQFFLSMTLCPSSTAQTTATALATTT